MGIKSLIGGLFHSEKQENQQADTLKTAEAQTADEAVKVQLEMDIANQQATDEAAKQQLLNDTANQQQQNADGKDKATEGTDKQAKTYNLIILDESGSMSGVRRQTISGCNETLNSIRSSAKDHEDIKQYVSIYCFDTENSRYLMKNEPIEKVRDITPSDYSPNACTPLYDAIGYTVTQLSQLATSSEAVGMVTIITDGYENASRKWTHSAVVELIKSLKKKGWVFTFIGANIDVEKTSRGLGINSFMEFEQTDEGMAEMFKNERRSRRAYFDKQSYLRGSVCYSRMSSEEEKSQALGAMNENFFVGEERITPNEINHLEADEVYVFCSNADGHHQDDAARYAVEHFGAIDGQAEGMQGQSYAIPSTGVSFEEMNQAIVRFTEFAVMHPEKKFFVTSHGWDFGEYKGWDVAPLFRQAYSFGNVYLPMQFMHHI